MRRVACGFLADECRSFLAGLLPLSFLLSQRQLRLITALGTGVLVGTSLIVIIPEGIETIYSASGTSHGHSERAVSMGDHSDVRDLAQVQWDHIIRKEPLADNTEVKMPTGATGSDFRTGPDDGYVVAEELAKQSEPGEQSGPSSEQKSADTSGSHKRDRDPHAYVGISLIAGFILMYLIDTIPKKATTSSQPQRFQINLTSFSLNRGSSPTTTGIPSTPNQESFAQPQARTNARPLSTTVGLVIHGLADGIALGASSTTASRLSFIIFIALMIHKLSLIHI